MIMENRRKKKLGDLAQILSSRRVFYSDYIDSGIPFLRSKEVIDLAKGDFKVPELFISEERFIELTKKNGYPTDGDILISAVGKRSGIPYIVRGLKKFYFKDGNVIWIRKNKKFSSEYLAFWFKSPIGIHTLNSLSIGSAQKALTIIGLKEIEINLPPLSEQKAIASVLSSLDDKIDLLHRQNQTLEAMAETLCREWFVEQADEDWEVKRLEDVVDISIGRTPPRKEFHWFSTNSDDVKWISIKDLGISGVFIFNTSEYLTKEAINKFRIPVIPKNTVVLSFKMTVGRVGITSEEMLSNEAIAHFKFTEHTPFTKEFLYLFLKSYRYETLGSTSSIVTSINSRMIRNIEVPIPNVELMKDFQKQTKNVFKKIKENQKQMQTLTQLRDTLLPKLMSGKVRVKNNYEY